MELCDPSIGILFPAIDPIAFSIPFTELAVRWYGLAYVAGLLLGIYTLKKLIEKNPAKGMGETTADDFFLWALLGVIVGGRLGYTLFYNPAFYLGNPAEILKVWEGGMSFHGGFLGVLVGAWLFCKKKKIAFFDLMDRVAPAACIGLFFGRIANLINAELYGKIATVPWAVNFPNTFCARHPSQLYEAFLEGILLFAILMFIATKRVRRYELSGIFLIGYGAFRSFVEIFREPDPLPHLQGGIFEFIQMGQILSLPMVAVGLYLLYLSKKAK